MDFYLDNSRVRGGSRDAMTEAAYTGWAADMRAGRTTLMAAATTADVTRLSARARADRVTTGQVEPGGVRLHDGNTAGVGDWVTTRRNNRQLGVRGGRDWVKNGDAWRVVARDTDGALAVRHLDHAGTVTLPADYVRAYVELLYATTATRAQGATVDTAHPLITDEMTRESLYVIATRARQHTTLYVVTHELPSPDAERDVDRTRTDPALRFAAEVLHGILTREGSEPSATEALRSAQDTAGSLATLVPRYAFAVQTAAASHYQHLATDVLGADLAERLVADPAWTALVRALTLKPQGGSRRRCSWPPPTVDR